ncbi:MAG: hypothetical protein BGN98_03315 [Microbacterium sp. 69-7]|nr:MAG: hypothetical protein BGN98_03315 [Microbacterium sp. 69-7]
MIGPEQVVQVAGDVGIQRQVVGAPAARRAQLVTAARMVGNGVVGEIDEAHLGAGGAGAHRVALRQRMGEGVRQRCADDDEQTAIHEVRPFARTMSVSADR